MLAAQAGNECAVPTTTRHAACHVLQDGDRQRPGGAALQNIWLLSVIKLDTAKGMPKACWLPQRIQVPSTHRCAEGQPHALARVVAG